MEFEEPKIHQELSTYWLEIKQDFNDILNLKFYNLEETITNVIIIFHNYLLAFRESSSKFECF